MAQRDTVSLDAVLPNSVQISEMPEADLQNVREDRELGGGGGAGQETTVPKLNASLRAEIVAMRTLLVESCDRLMKMADGQPRILLNSPSRQQHEQHKVHLLPLEEKPTAAERSIGHASSEPPKQSVLATVRDSTKGKLVTPLGTRGTLDSQGTKITMRSVESRGRKGQQVAPRVFIDAEGLKQELKNKLSKTPYNVAALYWETGCAQQIARSYAFEYTTGLCIILNAVWIGVDTDLNDAATLADAEPMFVIVENLFCIYFFAEWLVRFLAFKLKMKGLRDHWFLFDTGLVVCMILETWILSIIAAIVGTADLPSLAVFRVLRLTRMTRMVRLVKFFPELAVMMKAMRTGIRSVFWTLIFLLTLVYGFAVLFTQLLEGKTQPEGSMARENFAHVRDSVSTLLLLGALPDQADMMQQMGKKHAIYYLLLLIYLFFASITLMNMLTGTLTEVVRVISQVEREEAKLIQLRQSLEDIMASNDNDHNGYMNREEFLDLLTKTKYAHILNDMGIDVPGLLDLADSIFEDVDRELSFDEFTTIIFGLRDQNSATVKDLSELRTNIMLEVRKLAETLKSSDPDKTRKDRQSVMYAQ